MTTVTGIDWHLRAGDKLVLDGVEVGRIERMEVSSSFGTEATIIPELLFWHRVAGGLPARTWPGHEPGIARSVCGACAGAGQLYNSDGRRWWPVECWRCEGLGIE